MSTMCWCYLVYSSVLDSTTLDRLDSWVQQGGILVAAKDAAEFMTKDQSGFTSVELVEDEDAEKEEENGQTIDPAAYTSYAAREDTSGLKRIPGSAFKGQVDTTNPLAFGLTDRLYSLKFSNEALLPSTDWQVARIL